jgi:hypothetical protein
MRPGMTAREMDCFVSLAMTQENAGIAAGVLFNLR